jgi:glyoxylase-like metal-dependent hydrolase (beta-lactamase superfamily II)
MTIPLEDNLADILGKAQRGLGISDEQLVEESGASAESIRQLHGGNFDRPAVDRIAPVLRLDPQALAEMAEGKFQPNEIKLDGLTQFNTAYHDMQVNAYLVWDPATKRAVAFDTGADSSPMLEQAQKLGLTIELILLTHAHPDHVADLARLTKKTDAPAYLSSREQAPGAQAIEEGKKFSLGRLEIESRLTWGHSPGGMTFVVRGLEHPVAIVGDSLFAGSMGGGNVSYPEAVRNNLEKILTLPDNTILCPGHGPLTTVGEEKKHNPFFAGQI